MRKTIKLVAILAIMLIALSGCVSMDYGVKVNRNGSADVDYTLQYSVKDLESMGITTSTILTSLEKETEKLEKQGYSTQIISTEQTAGYKVTKHFDKTEDLTIGSTIGNTYIEEEGSDKIQIKKGIFTNKYSINTKIDLSSMTFTDAETKSYMGKTVDELFDIKMKADLPGIKGKNNATSTEKGTLVWQLKPGEINEVKYESTALTPLSIVLIIIAIGGIIAGGVVIILKGKKTSTPETKNKPETKKVEDKKEETANIEPKTETKTAKVETKVAKTIKAKTDKKGTKKEVTSKKSTPKKDEKVEK